MGAIQLLCFVINQFFATALSCVRTKLQTLYYATGKGNFSHNNFDTAELMQPTSEGCSEILV